MKNIFTQMTKRMGFLMTILFVLNSAQAQVRIDWQQCYGSFSHDYGHNIIQTSGGFLIFGSVHSDPNSGMYHCGSNISYRANWLFEIDNELNVIGQSCYELSPHVSFHKALSSKYYITGLLRNNQMIFNTDIRQIDAEGNTLWQKNLGTPLGALCSSSQALGLATNDGGVIAAANYETQGGDITHSWGECDCWLVKLDSMGNKLWDLTLGTEGDDYLYSLKKATVGGCYVGLYSSLAGAGNIVCNGGHGSVLCKVDAAGQLEWNFCFKGINIRDVLELEDGYLLAGDSAFAELGGNCHDGITSYDCCLLKCDLEGNVVWRRSYGGSCNEFVKKVFRNEDGGYTVFVNSKSSDGDLASAANLGVTGDEKGNIWVFRVDSTGNLLWERCIGSQLGLWEEVSDVIMHNDKEYTLVGLTTWFEGEASGDVSCTNNSLLPQSSTNIWLLHITDIYDYDEIIESPDERQVFSVIPNPALRQFFIVGKDVKQVALFNPMGQSVLKTNCDDNSNRVLINVQDVKPGIYFVRVSDSQGSQSTQKVILE